MTVTPRREVGHRLALGLQRLHLAGKPHAAVLGVAPLQGADADGVARRAKLPRPLIPDHAGKDAVQAVPQLVAVAVPAAQQVGGARGRTHVRRLSSDEQANGQQPTVEQSKPAAGARQQKACAQLYTATMQDALAPPQSPRSLLVEVAHHRRVGLGVQVHARQLGLAQLLVVVDLRVPAAHKTQRREEAG